MNSQVSLKDLGNDIKRIYLSTPSRAEALIEGYLEERFKGLPPDERLSILERLSSQFKYISPHITNNKDTSTGPRTSTSPHISNSSNSPNVSNTSHISKASHFDPDMLEKLYTLLLGEGVSGADFSSEETMEKLAVSLNTVFNRLNQLIRIIHTTLLGKSPEFETIRHIIGAELEGESPSGSLENYIDQIKEAFLSSHEAFKKAANTRFQEILNELDPDIISAKNETGLKFGPFRKAGCFEMYQERFRKFKKWFESGRFTEALLREFEKNCQKLYLEKRGKI